MGAWNNFLTWLNDLSAGGTVYNVTGRTSEEDDAVRSKSLNLKLLCINSAIGYLASGLTMAVWRTIVEGKDEYGKEYYRLNNAPNQNQNKAEFALKLVTALAVDNEAVIFCRSGSFYIADSWSYEPHGTGTDFYRSVMVDNDTVSFDLPSSEVIHLRMNWSGLFPLLSTLAEQYEDIITTAVDGYSRQTAEKGILKTSAVARGTKDSQEYRDRLLKQQFKNYFSSRSAVLTLRDGYEYTPTSTALRNTSELNDVANMTDEYAERVALALRVPPTLLKGNAENTEHAMEDLITYGVRPIAAQLEAEYGIKRLGLNKLMKGSRLFIDTTPIFLAIPEKAAEYCEKMTSAGQYSVDELRRLRGETLLGTREASLHYITKNYGELGKEEE